MFDPLVTAWFRTRGIGKKHSTAITTPVLRHHGLCPTSLLGATLKHSCATVKLEFGLECVGTCCSRYSHCSHHKEDRCSLKVVVEVYSGKEKKAEVGACWCNSCFERVIHCIPLCWEWGKYIHGWSSPWSWPIRWNLSGPNNNNFAHDISIVSEIWPSFSRNISTAAQEWISWGYSVMQCLNEFDSALFLLLLISE